MAKKDFLVNLDLNAQELQNASLEKLAADPTGADLFAGRIWNNTVDARVKWFDGTTVHVLAHYEDLNKLNQFIGGMDISGGTMPTDLTSAGLTASSDADLTGNDTAIYQGDFVRITVGGTATGVVGGTEVLEPGDVAFALVDNPTTNADWLVVQTNADLTKMYVEEDVAVTTVANTPLTVLHPTIIGKVVSMKVYDAAGDLVTTRQNIVGATAIIETNVAFTGTARVVGY